MADEILLDIQEEYPTARAWVIDHNGRLAVSMNHLELVRGIAGDLEVEGRTWALEEVRARTEDDGTGHPCPMGLIVFFRAV